MVTQIWTLEPHAEYLKISVKTEDHQSGVIVGPKVQLRRTVCRAAFTLCLFFFLSNLLVGLCLSVHCTTNLITFSSLHCDPLSSAG